MAITERFTDAMAQLGPYESSPHLAVALSGGADSMALCLLLHDWVHAQGGSLTALTIDHKLRPESTAEAAHIGTWMEAHNIPHEILALESLPTANLQAQAREARYKALTDYCRRHHILHLCIAHHTEDQAETVAMRAERAAQGDGVAGMSALTSRAGIRLLRPLLNLRKSELVSHLRSLEQEWVEDPSNQNMDFERVRMREKLHENDLYQSLTEKAANAALTRREGEAERARYYAEYVTLFPAGYAEYRYNEQLTPRLLGGLVQTISGSAHLPRTEKLERAVSALAAGEHTLTLGGCLLTREEGLLYISREINALLPFAPLSPNGMWDERFAFRSALSHPDYTIGALGEAGWLAVRDHFAKRPLPRWILPTLPTVWHLDKPICIPHIGYEAETGLLANLAVTFSPRKPLAGAPFTAMNNAH